MKKRSSIVEQKFMAREANIRVSMSRPKVESIDVLVRLSPRFLAKSTLVITRNETRRFTRCVELLLFVCAFTLLLVRLLFSWTV